MNFNNNIDKYRPIPFWSWNEKLSTDETRRQVQIMNKAGMGGYFIHARGGLQTEFMSDEWFQNILAAIEETKNTSMKPWAYDENGWPSGVANGTVCKMGASYQQKFLQIEEGMGDTPETICNTRGYHLYYKVNEHYIDTLNIDATTLFISEIYEKYYKVLGNKIEGFFTDEPQVTRNHIPWSFILPSEFQKRYEEDLLPLLPELFKPIGNYKRTRFRFWKLVTDLFSKNFMKPIYDWCDKHDLKLTGHLILEESLEYQLATNGAIMPHYEYFHIPGIDCLGKRMIDPLTVLQLSSVGHQLGLKKMISESFAGSGHNLGLDYMKGMFQSQAVRGITLLCQHLQGYSMRGIRKRDFPPALYYQQPWWDDYKIFNDYVASVCEILGEGKVKYDTLLIHPQSTAWIYFDNGENKGLKEIQNQFLSIINDLERKHILFHLGDETIMERHASVEGNTLIIGEQKYTRVILPPHEILFESTKNILSEFERNGGIITNADDIENNPLIDNPNIIYTKRFFENEEVYYFVNLTGERQYAKIGLNGYIMDAEKTEFYGEYVFEAYESIFIISESESKKRVSPKSGEKLKSIPLSGEWKIENCTPNILTLDKCDLYFDGKLIEKDIYVPEIQGKACSERRPINIKTEYKIYVDNIPSSIFLLCETPEIYKISINGTEIDKVDQGFYLDISFRKINIAGCIQKGINTVVLETVILQSEKVFDNIEKAQQFEGVKNKLTYDMEIEPIYIIGDFSVRTEGPFKEHNNEFALYGGQFVIDKPKEQVSLQNLERQGFVFFAGSITVSKEFEIEDNNYKLDFIKTGFNVVEVYINNIKVKTLLWEPFFIDLRDKLIKGKNNITMRLADNLQNMLGPHHCKDLEIKGVSPGAFFKNTCIWNRNFERPWSPEYCIFERSIKNRVDVK